MYTGRNVDIRRELLGTYAPVITWLSVRILLILLVLHDLEARSIYFTLVFLQADLDVDIHMELPPVFYIGVIRVLISSN